LENEKKNREGKRRTISSLSRKSQTAMKDTVGDAYEHKKKSP